MCRCAKFTQEKLDCGKYKSIKINVNEIEAAIICPRKTAKKFDIIANELHTAMQFNRDTQLQLQNAGNGDDQGAVQADPQQLDPRPEVVDEPVGQGVPNPHVHPPKLSACMQPK